MMSGLVSAFDQYRHRVMQFSRFLIVGGSVTVLSLLLSYVFLKVLEAPLIITYVLIYVATIFISYQLNARFTFQAGRTLRSLFLFYGSYIFTLGFGTALLALLRKVLDFENWVLVFMVVPVTTVMNYLLSVLIFTPLQRRGR